MLFDPHSSPLILRSLLDVNEVVVDGKSLCYDGGEKMTFVLFLLSGTGPLYLTVSPAVLVDHQVWPGGAVAPDDVR